MGHRIEAVFGGVLVLLAIAVAAFAMFSLASQPKARTASKIVTERAAMTEIQKIKTAPSKERPRACFTAASRIGAGAKFDVLSPVYETGYEFCGSRIASASAQRAWAAGWAAGTSPALKPFERSYDAWCRKNC